MKKYGNFLHTKAYKRTFLIYVAIALLFTVTILSLLYRDMRTRTQEAFLQEASSVYENIERQVGDLVTSIDQFTTQIYANPGLQEDFFLFFGSTAEAYTAKRLELGRDLGDGFLDACKTLVVNSNNCIRHIICYTRENVVDLEFNREGHSRHRIITTEEAEQICQSGCVYQKDIHRYSAYLGKIGFVLDISPMIEPELQNASGRGLCLSLPHREILAGQVQLPPEQVRLLLAQGGFPKRFQSSFGSICSMAHTSHYLPYSVIYFAQVRTLMEAQYQRFLWMLLGLLVVFTAIGLVLIGRFSRDTQYISDILKSMEQAEKENFAPVAIAGHNPEFDAIVRGLNDLYTNLENLIQREYKLTISQQKAQMDMLSAQLSPHFLYNTLERIRMRAVIDNAQDVAEATAGLGLLYRNIVKTEPVITMQRELEITEQYLNLMTFLYGDQFMYYFDVDPELEQMQTPKIWMQPIVENFFKHNFRQDDQIKVIVVELRAWHGGFDGRFFNNVGFIEQKRLEEINELLASDGAEGQGIGLYNVIHRLRLYYGSGLHMNMENVDPAGICIHIRYDKGEKDHVSSDDC